MLFSALIGLTCRVARTTLRSDIIKIGHCAFQGHSLNAHCIQPFIITHIYLFLLKVTFVEDAFERVPLLR